ncbi:hypothetical protein F4553_002218 [Allocatelliglobosispora scoriae]|uniref:F5/8 type C domain-containing protein n=1 Tax=Allocatelliglobosispora scoriae TaxID=643052 RepID=A0A841BNR7_9ACTN|nr:discoidin domain-containing protein [Allocatelliglobosispora scoriae]MBB5868839.1 hypothetical protein [Allocatelliglobosispora scoriae]
MRSSLWRPAVALAAILALAAPTIPAQAHSAQSARPAVAGLRKQMTWTASERQGGYVHVGSDGTTNAYTGDTAVDQYQPALCLRVDYQSPPGGITFDSYIGWSRGQVKATGPVRGDALASPQAADELCSRTFGAGWELAEFHDGRYGPSFEYQGGWSFWAAGDLIPGSRFWVTISDQPANAWNSAGTLPPALPAGDQNDLILKSRLGELVSPLLQVADGNFQYLVRNAVGRLFDGDDNVLLTDLIWEAEASYIVDPYDPTWVAFKDGVAALGNVNGETYVPQLFIPNYEDGVITSGEITLTVFESDLGHTSLPAYVLSNGQVVQRPTPVDEVYAETNEVWVLSLNEQIAAGSSTLTANTPAGRAERMKKKSITPAPVVTGPKATGTEATIAGRSGTNVTCNPTGLRNNRGLEYLQRFTIPNPSSVEHWTAGKLEPRMIIVAKDGYELKNAYFGKIKRKNVKNWVWQDLFITTWDRAVWGDYFAVKWLEIDNGPTIDLSLGLGALITQLLGLPITFDIKAHFEKKNDDMGSGVVMFSESTNIEYGTGTVYWYHCSSGGDGGTGNDNFARSAITSASSTFPGYSPARVNDGDRSTALGGGSSWANNAGGVNYPPQWVQLDFGVNKTFRRIVVFTTAGYEIQNFDIQIWNGITWVTPPGNVNPVTGNTATSRTIVLNTSQTSRLVRILGRLGPNIQQGFVRVNEFEVYAQ